MNLTYRQLLSMIAIVLLRELFSRRRNIVLHELPWQFWHFKIAKAHHLGQYKPFYPT